MNGNAPSAERQNPPWWQAASLFVAAIGVYGLAHDIVPGLLTLSRVLRWLVHGYEWVRDTIFGGLQWLLLQVNIVIPDIPELVKDGLMIAALIYAALNLESHRRDKAALHALVFQYLKRLFDYEAMVKNEDAGEAELLKGDLPAAFAFPLYFVINGLIIGALLWPFLPQLPFPAIASFALLAAVCGGLILLLRFGLRQIWKHQRALGPPIYLVLQVFWVPYYCLVLPLLALKNGWRAVALAVGLVVVIGGLNFAFAAYLDPMLTQIPDWEIPPPPL